MRANDPVISVRFPKPEDSREFITRARSSREFHRGFVEPPSNDEAFEIYLEKSRRESDRCFLIIADDDRQIAGAINLSQIFYGGFKNAYLGYYLFAGFSGRGIMTRALGKVIRIAFEDLRLHRLEANVQPHNRDSIRLVKKIGFIKEGYSRKYLKIGGKWCDHERWAMIKEDWIRKR
ncbi:MAG: GNAT family protein [Pyrinomonadaceae bacterium]